MKKNIKAVVKDTYTLIARQSKEQNETSCCGVGGCCSTVDYAVFSENYRQLKGYHEEADLGLGCGIPTQFASIKEGDSVLDLGSGAGNDCFVARAIVGETGKVVGIDFTNAMLEKARKNNAELGFQNVEFVKGDIENMPLADNQFDVVISNCVLNLVPDKRKAFAEIKRVLKTGGHFCVSDVVVKGNLPEKLKNDAENVCWLRFGSHRNAGISGYYSGNRISIGYRSQAKGSTTATGNFTEIPQRGGNPTV
jgi:SAM-dependent methyltransferase